MTSRGWEIYTREVKPINKKRLKAHSHKKENVYEATALKAAESASPSKNPQIGVSRAMPADIHKPLERRREKIFLRGEFPIESTLDLHGMTQTEAFDALANFMSRAVKSGKRYLLVISGKGSCGKGILRRNFENWLHQLPEFSSILALRPASPRHGGSGAFYVVLRKK